MKLGKGHLEEAVGDEYDHSTLYTCMECSKDKQKFYRKSSCRDYIKGTQ